MKKLILPEEYTILKPLPFRVSGPLYYPVCTVNIEVEKENDALYKRCLQEEFLWLDSVANSNSKHLKVFLF